MKCFYVKCLTSHNICDITYKHVQNGQICLGYTIPKRIKQQWRENMEKTIALVLAAIMVLAPVTFFISKKLFKKDNETSFNIVKLSILLSTFIGAILM